MQGKIFLYYLFKKICSLFNIKFAELCTLKFGRFSKVARAAGEQTRYLLIAFIFLILSLYR
jgi:hypothetical protein